MALCATPRTRVVASDRWAPAVYTSTGTNDVKLIAPANDARDALLVVLTSASAGTGHLRSRPTASAVDESYPLESAGEGVTINTKAEVYFVADSAAGATVKVIEELSNQRG